MLKEIYCSKFKIGGKNGETRPAIQFHEGLNAVIGDGNRSNSIGKSTLLMIIDFVFGGTDYIHKCAAVHQPENVGEHNICFTFEFDGKEYSFLRNNVKYQEIVVCNRSYEPIENKAPISLDNYMSFLAEKYDVNIEGLTWRGVMSKHIRVFNRDTMDASRPLQASKDGKIADDIKRYLKQFGRYAVVEKQINQAKVADDEKEAFRKSVAFEHIRMAKNDTEYKDNEKKAAELEIQEKQLAENSSKGLLDLDDMQAQRINELNAQLISYTRQRAKVQSQLNSLRREMLEGKKTFKRTYSDLEKFFPGIEFRRIEEIEKFHQSLSKVLTSEFKDSEKDLATTYGLLGNEIAKLKEQIVEIKSIPNVTQAVLKEYARITTELSNVKAANENYKTFDGLKATAKEYAARRDEVIAEQLSAIEDLINTKMKEITARIVNDIRIIPPKLHLEKMNTYSFDTKGDGGSGTALRGLITFDLVNMAVSNIPFVIHDADLMDPIEKDTLTKIIAEYDSVKKDHKQVFASFRSFEFYAEEVRTLLESCRVIQLEAKGQELFGWAWNKEVEKEES